MKTLGAIAILIAAVVYLNFGTLSPCGMLRQSVRQHDNSADVLPDMLVDAALEAQFGALSPGRCISILLNGQRPPIAGTQTTQQPLIQQPEIHQQASPAPMVANEAIKAAGKEAEAAMIECRAKRLSGELKTYVASSHCSNPRIIQAFSAANYKYMDLIVLWTAKRLELSEKVDRNELTEIQASTESAKAFSELVDAERRRDAGR
jgi:hypothetical protein